MGEKRRSFVFRLVIYMYKKNKSQINVVSIYVEGVERTVGPARGGRGVIKIVLRPTHGALSIIVLLPLLPTLYRPAGPRRYGGGLVCIRLLLYYIRT